MALTVSGIRLNTSRSGVSEPVLVPIVISSQWAVPSKFKLQHYFTPDPVPRVGDSGVLPSGQVIPPKNDTYFETADWGLNGNLIIGYYRFILDMYGGGYGFGMPGYSSPMDTNPYVPGTQLNPYDADPTRPGVQLPGAINGMPHYSSPIDTNPFVAGTQVGGMTIGQPGMGMGMGMGMGGAYTTTTTTYNSYGGTGFF